VELVAQEMKHMEQEEDEYQKGPRRRSKMYSSRG